MQALQTIHLLESRKLRNANIMGRLMFPEIPVVATVPVVHAVPAIPVVAAAAPVVPIALVGFYSCTYALTSGTRHIWDIIFDFPRL